MNIYPFLASKPPLSSLSLSRVRQLSQGACIYLVRWDNADLPLKENGPQELSTYKVTSRKYI